MSRPDSRRQCDSPPRASGSRGRLKARRRRSCMSPGRRHAKNGAGVLHAGASARSIGFSKHEQRLFGTVLFLGDRLICCVVEFAPEPDDLLNMIEASHYRSYMLAEGSNRADLYSISSDYCRFLLILVHRFMKSGPIRLAIMVQSCNSECLESLERGPSVKPLLLVHLRLVLTCGLPAL